MGKRHYAMTDKPLTFPLCMMTITVNLILIIYYDEKDSETYMQVWAIALKGKKEPNQINTI